MTSPATMRTRSEPDTGSSVVSVPGVSVGRVLAAEWHKLWSVRGTTIGLVLSVLTLIGVGMVTSGSLGETFATGGEPDGPPFLPRDPVQATLGGVPFVQLLIGAIGVIVASVEYSTGMIRSTLAAVPTRLPVLWAKALVFGAVVFVLTLAAAVVAFFAGSALLATHGVDPSLADPGVARAILATPVYLTGIGVAACALAVLLRSTAVSVSVVTFVVFLMDTLVDMLLPAAIGETVVAYLPATAGTAFLSTQPVPGALTPGAGFAVFCAWVLTALVAAALMLRRADV